MEMFTERSMANMRAVIRNLRKDTSDECCWLICRFPFGIHLFTDPQYTYIELNGVKRLYLFSTLIERTKNAHLFPQFL